MDSELSIETGRHNRPSLSVSSWQMFIEQSSAKYSLFFSVKLREHFKHDDGYFVFEFNVLSLASEERYEVSKRYSQFEDLERELKDRKLFKVKLPVLPTKTLQHSDSNMSKRHQQLGEWLAIVLNERMYHCPPLFRFLGITEQDQNCLHKVQEIASKISIKLSIAEHVAVNQLEENFVVYNMRVTIADLRTKDKIGDYTVGRRFREFDCLNKVLQRKFARFNNLLPDLPSRMAPFTSALARQQLLDTYVARLVNLKDIFEVMAFRKFIGLDHRVLRSGGDLYYN